MKLRGVDWRQMTAFDLAEVERIAGLVHRNFYEAPEVLAERHRLYRHGTFVLEIETRIVGYILSHPWRYADLPPLNTLLGAIPGDADTYYIHDVALLPVARKIGAASHILAALVKHARVEHYPTMTLVAVNASQPFWRRHGFETRHVPALAAKLASYEASAEYMCLPLLPQDDMGFTPPAAEPST